MEKLLSLTSLNLYPNSVVCYQGVEYGMAQTTAGSQLVVLAPRHSSQVESFEGEASELDQHTILVGQLTTQNMVALRSQLPWLRPQPLGLHTSVGMGDRLGIATPGHVRAMTGSQGGRMPIFAQQSIREMVRTGRTPQQVLDEATWGVFEAGWQRGMGADADHLKTVQHIDACLEAGYTFFTFDPGAFVDNESHTDDMSTLKEKAERVPAHLKLDQTGLSGKIFDVEGNQITLDEPTLLKALVKYGRAIAHVVSMYEHLRQATKNQPFEVEISMDETELPTSPAEHIYIAHELRRLGVSWVSFAPRFIGRFEKGVDYIGDLKAFEADLAIHAAIARQLGPYKLSLHSGSDKFSIYPLFMQKTQGMAHLKTAGTSYLEGLRTIAAIEVNLIKEIYHFALERFETDKQSYLISARVANAPKPEEVTDWQGLFDQFDAREIFHVTYGSVLTEKMDEARWRFYDRLMDLLKSHRELYFDNLEKHFKHHLALFSLVQ
jgi:hypothetical protein